MYLIIRKHLTSSIAGNDFWGNFYKFTELNLTNDQLSKLVDFYSAADYYKLKLVEHYTTADGFHYKYIVSPTTNEVFNYSGTAKINYLKQYARSIPEYTDFVQKKETWFAEMGWVSLEERIVEVDLNYDEETFTWGPLPTTFEEINALYEAGVPSSSLLGN